jgi:hypothetical protein
LNTTDVQRAQWATVFLGRLERLCHLEERFVSPPDALADPQRLVYKAIFATYCDCVGLGRKHEAERIMSGRTARDRAGKSSASGAGSVL